MSKRPPTITIAPDDIDAVHLGRFQAKVQKVGDCALWTAATNSSGYGVFSLNGRQVYAHRVAWVLLTGRELPVSLQVDHLCRNRLCVSHLEAVTPAINTDRQPNAPRRRTHCPKGHAYEGANLYRFPDGRRACRTCMRAAQASYSARKKATA